MQNKFLGIERKTYLHILILLILSILTTIKAKISYDSFTNSNIPIYDGVIYQIQQIRRYELFIGDFSWINRYSQAVYEFQGNYVSAAYSGFITFFFPSFLKNDTDIFIRSLFSIFIFSLSIYVFFKDKIKPFKLIIILTTFLQFPVFYHHQVGLGSYIPELTASLILVSGFIFLLHFFSNFKFRYCFIGVVVMLLPITFRFNFFAYCFLFSLPPFLLFIKNWKNFDSILRKRILVFIPICILLTGAYILYFFAPFYKYYTETAYNYSYFSLAFSTMANNMNDYFNWVGFLAILLILFSNDKIEKPLVNNSLIAYPFLIFFSFIILYLKSENIPHINAAMAVFFSLVSFVSFPIFKTKFPKLFSDKKVVIYLSILIGCLNFSFINSLDEKKDSHLYKVQRNIITFLTQKVNENPQKLPTYLCVFEGMAEIPINVGVYTKTNKLLTIPQSFYNHDIFYINSMKCDNANECFEHYLPVLTSVDYIMVNANNPKINLFPIARSLNIKLKNYLHNNPKFEICKKIQSTFYGEVLIYRHKKLINEIRIGSHPLFGD